MILKVELKSLISMTDSWLQTPYFIHQFFWKRALSRSLELTKKTKEQNSIAWSNNSTNNMDPILLVPLPEEILVITVLVWNLLAPSRTLLVLSQVR